MLAMPTDPIAELRSTISEQLRRFWRADPSEELQEDSATELPRDPQAPALDSPRSGIAYPAPANRLREDVAAEIASRLRQERRSFGELLRQNHEESTGEATLSSTTASSLPLGACFKPRGIFEGAVAKSGGGATNARVSFLHGLCDSAFSGRLEDPADDHRIRVRYAEVRFLNAPFGPRIRFSRP